MGLDDMKDKAKDAATSEKATDAGLDKGEKMAEDRSGGKYGEQIDKGRDAADDKLGNG